ncbi:hypothetical protein BS78_10G265300 [Paspalum vaginatum]|nr:hypothetical protein BS78_10G265300 [Paspalum vaginatum]
MKHHHLFLSIVLSLLVALAAAADPRTHRVLLQEQHSQMRMMSRSLLQQQPIMPDCPSSCSARCSRNWKNEMCNKMCNACCHRCGCVPPGTGQDTRHLCPCYDTLTNPHTGKLKCP